MTALTLIDVALSARARGLSVHPPVEDGSKAPLPFYPAEPAEDGKPRKTWLHPPDAPPDEATIRAWYGPLSGVGLRTGGESGGLECFEFDCPAVYAAFVAAAAECGLADLLARIEAGYRERTPGDGIHLLYFTDEVEGNKKLAKRPEPTPKNPHGAKTLIETRGENGFIIVAPSGGAVHESGRPYVLTSGGLDSIVTISGEERAALFDLARSFDEMPRPTAGDRGRGRPPAVSTARPGDLWAAATDWADIMSDAGWHLAYRRGDESYWRRPDKAMGVGATTNYRGSDLLYVFTTSTSFDSEKSYTKFGAYAHLHHGGNANAAARALRDQGWKDDPGRPATGGTRPRPDPDGSAAGSATDQQPDIEDAWPEIDPAAFHGIAGDLVRMADPHTEGDPIAVLIQFLAGFANMVGRGPHWHAGADSHYLSIFAVLIGPTAAGRKGTSWGIARHLLAQVDEGWALDRVNSGLASGEGLIHAVRDKIVRVDKGGDEEIIDEGVADKRLLVLESEFGRPLRVMARDGNTLRDVLREAWDCHPRLQTMTKHSPTKATNAHISVLGHITRPELATLLAKGETSNGLGNRFLWLCVRRSKELPAGGRFHDVNWSPLADRLRDIVAFARAVGTMRRDEEAADAWERPGGVYSNLTAGRPGLLGSMLGRGEAQVMRLACIYALLDRSYFVRAEHLAAALAIWEYVVASATYIFGDSLGDPQAEKLLAALRDAPDGLTRSQITADVFGGHVKAADMASVLQTLLGMGLIRCDRRDDGKPGRPAQVWRAGGQFRPARIFDPDADPGRQESA